MGARSQHVALCDSKADKAQNRNAVLCKLDLANGTAPVQIPMFPAPGAEGLIKGRDGRVFFMKDAAQVVALFNDDAHEIPLDWEHASEIVAPYGGQAPAAGWISKLHLQADGSILGDVEWTAKGRASVESKEYRYVSPAFRLDPETREIQQLLTAGLTNTPAMTMPALTHVQKDQTMNPELLKLLGLDDKATPEQIATATRALQAKMDAEKAAQEAARVKLEAELAAARSQAAQPNIKDFVPRADYDATLARVTSLETAAKQEKETAHARAVDTAIVAARVAGKITPASEAYYRKQCATAQGLADFQEFASAQAPIVTPASTVTGTVPAAGAGPITPEEIEVARRLNVTPEQMLAARQSN